MYVWIHEMPEKLTLLNLLMLYVASGNINSTRNIHPFFTASYQVSEIQEVNKSSMKKKLKLIYVGALTKSKQPILSVKSAEYLLKQGLNLELNMGIGENIMGR